MALPKGRGFRRVVRRPCRLDAAALLSYLLGVGTRRTYRPSNVTVHVFPESSDCSNSCRTVSRPNGVKVSFCSNRVRGPTAAPLAHVPLADPEIELMCFEHRFAGIPDSFDLGERTGKARV